MTESEKRANRAISRSTAAIMARDFCRTSLKSWKQLVSIVAISFLALCLFCGLTSNAYLVSDRVDIVFENSNYPDIFVTTTSISQDDVEAMEEIDGVESVETRIYAPMNISSQVVYMIGADADSELSVPYMISGTRGIVVTNELAEDQNLRIGSTFTMTIASSFLEDFDEFKPIFDLAVLKGGTNIFREDSIPIDFAVTGICYHPEGMGNANMSGSLVYCDMEYLVQTVYDTIASNYSMTALNYYFGLCGIDLEDVVASIVPSLKNQALIDSSAPEATIASVREYFASSSSTLISAQLGTDTSGYREIEQEVKQSMQLTYVFPVIFFLVSVLVILTTISQLIIKQRSQIGTFKAIGVPRWRIYVHYCAYGAITTAFGALLGFIVGPLFIPRVLNIKYDILWDLPSASVRFFHPASIIVCIVMILAAALCSFLISWSVIKEKPVDTLRPKKQKTKTKQSNPKSLFSKLPLELKMALRNIRMNIGKTAMVIIGMLGCCGLLVCGFGIMDTIDYDIDLDFNQTLVFDLVAVPSSTSNTLKYEISNVDGVERVESLSTQTATVSGEYSEDVTLYLVEDNSVMFNIPTGVDGGVSMSSVTAENLGIEVGDTFTMAVNGITYERTLTYTYQTSTLNGVVELSSDFTRGTFSTTMYMVNLADGADADRVADAIDTLEDVYGVKTHDWMMSYANNLVETISLMTTVVEVFAILLSLVVVYNLTSLNITSRHREIATMKVLGFRYWEITKTLTYEMMIDVVIGSLLGLLAGWPMTYLVMITNTTSLFNFIFHINWWTYLMSFAIAVVAALITSLLLCLKTKTINMSESLKSVEE